MIGRVTGCVAACALLGVAFAQVSPTGHGYYRFRAKHRKGTVSRYTATTLIQRHTITNDVQETVTGVHNGVATLQIAIRPATELKPNEKFSFGQKAALKVDSLNHPIGSPGVPNILAEFPKPPIKVGAVWTGLSSFATGAAKGGSLATSFRFSSIEHSKGKTVAVLNVLLKGIANGSGAMLIDASDGSLLASFLRLSVPIGDGQSQTIQVQVRRR